RLPSPPAPVSSSLALVSHCWLSSRPTRRSSDPVCGHHQSDCGMLSDHPARPQLRGFLKGDGLLKPRGAQPIPFQEAAELGTRRVDRKSTRLNSSHGKTSYAVFAVTKKRGLEFLL